MSIVVAKTGAQLDRYGDHFSPEVVAKVDGVAEALYACDVDQVLVKQGIGEPLTLNYQRSDWAQLQLLDIRGDQPLDDRRALLWCLPHARGLTKFAQLQIAVLRELLPDRRIIAVASPDGSKQGTRLLTRAQRQRVAGGDLGPLYQPLLQYLSDTGAEDLDIVGGSYGTEVGSWIAAHTPEGLTVNRLLLTEPAAVRARSFGRMIFAFATCGPATIRYERSVQAQAHRQALETEPGRLEYVARLARLGCLAIGRSIAKGELYERLDTAHDLHPALATVVAHGSESELAVRPHVLNMVRQLNNDHQNRIQLVTLNRAAHWAVRDIHLFAALVLHTLESSVPQSLEVQIE